MGAQIAMVKVHGEENEKAIAEEVGLVSEHVNCHG